jgi:hypothetical protein
VYYPPVTSDKQVPERDYRHTCRPSPKAQADGLTVHTGRWRQTNDQTSPLLFVVVSSGDYPQRVMPGEGAHVWNTMLQSLLTPRYPRRYIGRHRMRFTIRFISTTAGQRGAGSMGERNAA